jgi:hypothetical protein
MWQGSIAVVENFLLQDCWWCNANVSETTCASSAILPNLTSAAVDRKFAQLSLSVDRLFRGSQNTMTCDITSLLHLFAHLSYSLFSNVNKLRFHKSVRCRGMTRAICRWPLITEAPVSIHCQHTWFFSAQNGTWTDFCSRASLFPYGDQSVFQYIIYPSSMMSNISDWQLH